MIRGGEEGGILIGDLLMADEVGGEQPVTSAATSSSFLPLEALSYNGRLPADHRSLSSQSGPDGR